MTRVDPQLVREWRRQQEKTVDLILHIEGDPAKRSAQLQEQGVSIKRRFRMTRTLSVRCKAKEALALTRTPWITKIEPDQNVKALGR